MLFMKHIFFITSQSRTIKLSLNDFKLFHLFMCWSFILLSFIFKKSVSTLEIIIDNISFCLLYYYIIIIIKIITDVEKQTFLKARLDVMITSSLQISEHNLKGLKSKVQVLIWGFLNLVVVDLLQSAFTNLLAHTRLIINSLKSKSPHNNNFNVKPVKFQIVISVL